MYASDAYGLCLLSSLFTALLVWSVCWRYWSAKRLPEHEGYIRGWDACSRVRDREESHRRKLALLNIGTLQSAPTVVVGDSASNYAPKHAYTDWCTCQVCNSARSCTAV